VRAIDIREIRETDGAPERILLTIVVQRSSTATSLDPLREAARELVEAEPAIAGVAVNFHEGDAPQILGSETVVIHGATSANDRVGASTHVATFGSFVQAHRGQALRVHDILVEALGIARARKAGRTPRILDLYGGSGAIALALAGAG